MSSDDEKKIDASVSAEEVEKVKAEIAEEVCYMCLYVINFTSMWFSCGWAMATYDGMWLYAHTRD